MKQKLLITQGGFLYGDGMTQSKTVFVERTNSPPVAPGTVAVYARDTRLYMKDDLQQVTEILSAAVSTDLTDVPKIDSEATDGLAGVSNSLAYRVHELERHFHNRERWWGAVAVPDETNAIEANVNRPFTATSGANAWGAAIPICGTADAPVPSPDNVKHDLHRIAVTDLDADTTPWRVRIIWGAGTSADAITAGQWTEAVVMTNAVPGNRAGGSPVDVIMRRVDVGTKIWAQCWNDTAGEVLSFFWGTHGYPG